MLGERVRPDVVVAIGNGFDLKNGLKSTFADFFRARFAFKNLGNWKSKEIYKNVWYVLLAMRFFIKTDERLFARVAKNDIRWMDVETFIVEFLSGEIDGAKKDLIGSLFDSFQNHGVIKTQTHYFDTVTYDQINELCKALSQTAYSGENPYDYLLKQLKKFESDFSEYMREEVGRSKFYDMNASEFFSLSIQENLNSVAVFLINFNYTEFDGGDDRIRVVHPHGTLKESNAIIGIDNSSIGPNEEDVSRKRRFSKAWRKIVQTDDGALEPLPPKEDIRAIAFYGLSLAKQDYSYYHALFQFYSVYSSSVKLVFFYSDYKETEWENEANRLAYIDAVFALLNEYATKVLSQEEASTFVSKLQLEGRLIVEKIG